MHSDTSFSTIFLKSGNALLFWFHQCFISQPIYFAPCYSSVGHIVTDMYRIYHTQDHFGENTYSRWLKKCLYFCWWQVSGYIILTWNRIKCFFLAPHPIPVLAFLWLVFLHVNVKTIVIFALPLELSMLQCRLGGVCQLKHSLLVKPCGFRFSPFVERLSFPGWNYQV